MDGGFVGLLDFIGYPVGFGAFVPRGGIAVGGRRINLLRAYMIQESYSRSMLDHLRVIQQKQTEKRLEDQTAFHLLEKSFQNRVTEASMYTALLVEL